MRSLASGVRNHRYLWVLLCLVPLGISLWGAGAPDDLGERLQRSVENAPEEVRGAVESGLERGDVNFVLFSLPGHKLDGAFLGRDTKAHWLLAMTSLVLFVTAVVFLFPRGGTTATGLTITAIVTATVGVVLLLGIQWVAEVTQDWVLVGFSPKIIVFYVLKFIGTSYRGAADPNNGFLLSMLGFTFGVGFCEELVKVLPVWFRAVNFGRIGPRGVIAIGFASGVGFGVSEGIIYSTQWYNGVQPLLTYVVRFVSCVALHAVWAATAGLTLFRRRGEVESSESFLEAVAMLVAVLSVPMVLHGLYDTALKREMYLVAFLAAAVSFGWFFRLLSQAQEGVSQKSPATT